MNVVNCRRCKKIFNKINSPYCPACQEAEEELFRTVREYLYSNPRNNVQQIADETGIPVSKIMDLLRDCRFGLG